MKDKLHALMIRLNNSREELRANKVVAGFDGFIDSIQRVIHTHTKDRHEYFKTIGDFGRYISSKQAGGLSLETEEIIKKPGGNVPITANAIAQFGVTAQCIGAFGYPAIDPAFSSMSSNMVLHSFADPGITSALEFDNGKIMLAQMTGLNGATWELIKEYIGLRQIIQIFDSSELICLLNWSEVRYSNAIWQGIIQEVLPMLNANNRRKILVDLSDCSKHDSQHIREALVIIQEFSKWCDVTLSLNRNEAKLVSLAIDLNPSDAGDLQSWGTAIYRFMNIDTLVIHTSSESLAWKKSNIYRAQAFQVKDQLISTGAGDNFNAGFSIGQMLGLEPEELLILANLIAAYYMVHAKSPRIADLERFIELLV